MKKVQYDGEDTRELPTLGVVVTKGDVIEVPDDFDVFNFSPADGKKAKISVPLVVETPAVTEVQIDPTSDTPKENS